MFKQILYIQSRFNYLYLFILFYFILFYFIFLFFLGGGGVISEFV